MTPLVERFIEYSGAFTEVIEGKECTCFPGSFNMFMDTLMVDIYHTLKERKSIGGNAADLRTELHIKEIMRRYGVSNQALASLEIKKRKPPAGKKLKRHYLDSMDDKAG